MSSFIGTKGFIVSSIGQVSQGCRTLWLSELTILGFRVVNGEPEKAPRAEAPKSTVPSTSNTKYGNIALSAPAEQRQQTMQHLADLWVRYFTY